MFIFKFDSNDSFLSGISSSTAIKFISCALVFSSCEAIICDISGYLSIRQTEPVSASGSILILFEFKSLFKILKILTILLTFLGLNCIKSP